MSSRGFARRAFLQGVGGVSVGLPFLNAIHGRASAQATTARPKRLAIFYHPHGTVHSQWKPSSTGALGTLPNILAPLESLKSRVNVISGIDNVVSPLCTSSNGHNAAGRTLLTCQPFVGVKQGQQPDNGPADGPSIDWVVGPRLKGDAPRAVVNLGVTDMSLGEYTAFWTKSGEAANVLTNAQDVVNTLFSNVSSGTPTAAPAAPTPEELFRGRRASIVDKVLDGYKRLAARVPAEDKLRLESHMEQLRSVSTLSAAAGGSVALASCSKPKPSFPSGYDSHNADWENATCPAQIENAVMALACDITRVVTLQFTEYNDPRFPWLFSGDRNAIVRGANSTYNSFHTMVHEAKAANDQTGINNQATGYRWYMQQLADFATRLSRIEDGPGQTMLDNTLILAISEFGDGSQHDVKSLPVLLIGGLAGRIQTGRHIDATGYTTGDLYTTVQNLLLGDQTKFGITGNNSAGRAFHKGLIPGLT